MCLVERVAEWVESDLAALSVEQAAAGRQFLVVPQSIVRGPDPAEVGVIVAHGRSNVVYFDAANDDFAIGKLVGDHVVLCGLYGDFRYAIQALIQEEKRTA